MWIALIFTAFSCYTIFVPPCYHPSEALFVIQIPWSLSWTTGITSALANASSTLGFLPAEPPCREVKGGAVVDSALCTAYHSTATTSSRGRTAHDRRCHLPLEDSLSFAVDTWKLTLSHDIRWTTHNIKKKPCTLGTLYELKTVVIPN